MPRSRSRHPRHQFLTPLLAPAFADVPFTVVDVGAAGGIADKWRRLPVPVRVLAFDPGAHAPDTAGDDGRVTVQWYPVALGAEPGTRTLHLTRKAECSSFFEPNQELLDRFDDAARFDVIATEPVVVDTLDRVVEAAGRPPVDILKMDVQGAALDVLAGAQHCLAAGVLGIEVEAEMMPLYVGEPLFADVDAVLRDQGFELFDLNPVYWKRRAGPRHVQAKGQMAFADALYFRDPGWLDERLRAAPTAAARRALASRMAVAYLSHGYVDAAGAVLAAVADDMDQSDRALMSRLASGRFGLSRLRRAMSGRRRHALSAMLADLLDPAYQSPGTLGGRLGNPRD